MKISQIYNFTPLENATIKELLQYSMGKKVESARILKNNKNITNKFIVTESPYKNLLKAKLNIFPWLDYISPWFSFLKKKMLLKNATYIHYHPKPLPLSYGDILQAFGYRMQKMIAVFDDGRYSVFCPNKNAKISTEELEAGNKILAKNIKQAGGEANILKNTAWLEEYKAQMHSYWQKLAKETNSQYFSNM